MSAGEHDGPEHPVGKDFAGEDPKRKDAPISNGPNARPRDETISSTGQGIPNDSGEPIAVDEQEVAEIENRIRRE